MKLRSIKIVSDGTPQGTKVVDEETGEEINRVQRIEWQIAVGDGYATAKISVHRVPVEISGAEAVERQIDG